MLTKTNFPNDFIFGAATSSYQIEGQSFGGAGRTHWDSFADRPGAVSDGSNGAIACDHYHRYAEDLDLLRGLQGYRFSTSWARVLPNGTGTPNREGLDYYDRLVDTILDRGLSPFLTLYHWDLPEVLAQKGGWRNPDIAHWFADYAQVVMARIGDRVESVATINEPWCVSWLSHFLGHHAPGLTDIGATAKSMHYILAAHAEAVSRLRTLGYENLGIVLNFEHAQAVDQEPINVAAAKRYDAIYNEWFISAICHGRYPAAALEGLEAHLPKNWQDDLEHFSQPIDWLGVNYYTRQLVEHDGGLPWPHYKTVAGDLPKSDMGWEIYPHGLKQFLCRLKDNFVGDKPIFVTENGIALSDEVQHGEVADSERLDYIQSHLSAVRTAMDHGANVKGYFYWSLLDNFEWAFGYEKRFGLVHVDFATQKRTVKNSYRSFLDAFAREEPRG